MPGSWEIKAQRKVLVYTIHTDLCTMAWAAGLRNLIIPGTYTFLSGMPYDHARNAAVHQFLASPFEWLFSLDSDVIPPPDAILRLLGRNVPIISGVYHRRSPPHGVPVMIRNSQWVTKYTRGEVLEVDLVGAGCLLTHRSVYERIPPQRPGKPWFDWRVDLKGTGVVPDHECMSEDFSLCMHWKKHGLKVLVDTSVQCRHAGPAQAIEGAMVPLEATSVT